VKVLVLGAVKQKRANRCNAGLSSPLSSGRGLTALGFSRSILIFGAAARDYDTRSDVNGDGEDEA
jgi:hypothetical protein